MTVEQAVNDIMVNVEVEAVHYPNQPKGGQQVAMTPKGVQVSHPDVDISVYYGEYRTQIENKTKAISLFKEILRDTIINRLEVK